MKFNRTCKVWFNDDSVKIFKGWWTNIILDIAAYCEETGLETVKSEWSD